MFALLKIFAILGLIGTNAVFVAAEYALLSVRRTRLEQLANEGNSRARLVLSLLTDVVALFSGTQVGITVISLLMGWLGEGTLAAAVESALAGHVGRWLQLALAHTISVVVAFLIITTLLMVLGELVPKALAYEGAEQFALSVAPFLSLFLRLSRPPVRILNLLASAILRSLRRSPSRGLGPLHTEEEVKLIVSEIRKRGLLDAEQEDMIHSVFDLDRVRVREIMVPWNRATCLPISTDFAALLDRVVRDQHSRIPIYEALPDQIIGVLNTKDLLPVLQERTRTGTPLGSAFDLRAILHQPMIVPEAMSLTQMLHESRRRRAQMALVVDEFGTFVGLVTIEDVLEQIVGDIQDEYDLEEASVRKIGENVMVVDASISLRELGDERDLVLPREGYETLAGFVLARLGFVPRGGESFVYESRRYTVMEMEGRRVSKVRIETMLQPAATAKPAEVPATRHS